MNTPCVKPSWIWRWRARPRGRERRRARADLVLEALESRLAMSAAVVWSGLDAANPTLWNDAANWIGDQVPSAGASVEFPKVDSLNVNGVLYPTGNTVDIQQSADVSAMQIGDSYTIESTNSTGVLTLDPGAAITVSGQNSLILQQGLRVDIPGATQVSFSGLTPQATAVDLKTQQVTYPGTVQGLLPVNLGGDGTLLLDSTTNLLKTSVNVGTGSAAMVPSGVFPQVGSLTGPGTVQMNGAPGDATHLSMNPPPGETDQFTGTISGSGGLFSIDGGNAPAGQAAGTQVIGSFNPSGAVGFQIQVNSGSMQFVSVMQADTVTVASGASFGGSATMTIMGAPGNPDLALAAASTFDAVLNGNGAGQYTALTAQGADPSGGSTVELAGSNLSLAFGPGYLPGRGDSFTIISTPNGSISGQFANAPNLGTISVDNIPFLVHYNQTGGVVTSVSLNVDYPTSLILFQGGELYQYQSNGNEYISSGVISADMVYSASGSPIYDIVFKGGALYQYDATGAHHLSDGVRSVAVAVSPSGGLVYDIVFQGGAFYEYDQSGAHFVTGGVQSASIAYSPTGSPVHEIVFQGGALYLYDAAGAHLVTQGVQTASVAFDLSGALSEEIVFDGGALYLYWSQGVENMTNTAMGASLTY